MLSSPPLSSKLRNNPTKEDLFQAAELLDAPDVYPYTAFITAQSKETNEGNLPLKLLVCPAHGLDFSIVYTLEA